MNFRLLTFATLCALCLALLLTITPAVAQTSSDKDTAASNISTDRIVPGTGVTMAELKDLGWNPDQIADMQTPGAAGDNTAANQDRPANPQNANTETAANNGGGNGWGLWGLIGLLGLLGLGGRGRRAETVRDERDIRRVA